MLGLPVDRVWPQDTEPAPGIFRPPICLSRSALTRVAALYSISIDYGRSHYLMLDANDERDVQILNDISYNKDPDVRASTLKANRERLG